MLHNTDKNNNTKKTQKPKRDAASVVESTAAARDVLILRDGTTEMHASKVRLGRQRTVLSCQIISNISFFFFAGEIHGSIP